MGTEGQPREITGTESIDSRGETQQKNQPLDTLTQPSTHRLKNKCLKSKPLPPLYLVMQTQAD